MAKTKTSEYDLFNYYVSEYDYIKKRLKSMDFNNNPVIADEEYIKILEEENDILKDENIKLRLKISNINLINNLPWYKRIKYAITKKL